MISCERGVFRMDSLFLNSARVNSAAPFFLRFERMVDCESNRVDLLSFFKISVLLGCVCVFFPCFFMDVGMAQPHSSFMCVNLLCLILCLKITKNRFNVNPFLCGENLIKAFKDKIRRNYILVLIGNQMQTHITERCVKHVQRQREQGQS